MSEIDPFEGREPHPGLEHLGRAIVDASGVPSGSPANYETTRGKGATTLSSEDRAQVVANIAAEFAAERDVPEAHPWAAEAKD